MPTVAYGTLTEALGLGRREVAAFVGGGGKTSALQALSRELAFASCAIVTTTTAMFRRELSAAGPVTLAVAGTLPFADLRLALRGQRVVGVALEESAGGKVAGLPPAMIDALWAEGLVDYLVVEADGSRGKSLKAFAAHEPQVPSVATTIVQVAGVDAAGRPLSEEYVHRADLLAAVLKVPSGVEMSSRLVAECLREQLRHLHRGWPDARLITLLNKVDRPADETRALNVARELSLGAPAPDAIVVASVRERRYARVDLVQAPRA